MKSSALLSVLAAILLLPGASAVRAGDSVPDAPAKKPIARRALPESVATTAAPVMRRDSRPLTPPCVEARIARVRPAPPWLPGAPGD